MVSLTDAITASIVHFSYAHKVWMLLRFPWNYVWTGMVLLLSCTQLTAGIGCTIFMFIAQITLPQFGRIKTWVCIWRACACRWSVSRC